MKITHLQSSTQLIHLGDITVLTDPWLTDGEYYGSWYHYPPFDTENLKSLEYDFIYVSHIHPDHLSEKTFKTIATQTPFMILGNKGSLKKLHDLGYKTFHNIINENYDTLDSVHRIEAIVEELKAWKSNPNKFRHWSWLKSILEHNFEVLKFNSLFNPPPKFFEITELLK